MENFSDPLPLSSLYRRGQRRPLLACHGCWRRGVGRSLSGTLGIIVLGLSAVSGCIHPNIPSVRYGPAGPDLVTPDTVIPEAVTPDAAGGFFSPPAEEMEKPPEVPWPRFHPLPTRPVLGPPG